MKGFRLCVCVCVRVYVWSWECSGYRISLLLSDLPHPLKNKLLELTMEIFSKNQCTKIFAECPIFLAMHLLNILKLFQREVQRKQK